MAGFGSRFKERGYTAEKYEIIVNGRTLFDWSLSSLQSFIESGAMLLFIVRKEQNATQFIDDSCKKLQIHRYRIIELLEATDGQASTALKAGPALLNKHEPFSVYNIDTYITPGTLQESIVTGDGWIPCFNALGNHWSFVEADQTHKAIRVEEKNRISSHATVGFYYFKSFSLFAKAVDDYYRDKSNLRHTKEKYIAPVYNQMILEGKEVNISIIPSESVHCLGTPDEVDAFQLSLDGHPRL